jgi:hypothetical protein
VVSPLSGGVKGFLMVYLVIQQQQRGRSWPHATTDGSCGAPDGSTGPVGYGLQLHELSMRMHAYYDRPSCAATVRLAVAHVACVEFAMPCREGPPLTALAVRDGQGWLPAGR